MAQLGPALQSEHNWKTHAGGAGGEHYGHSEDKEAYFEQRLVRFLRFIMDTGETFAP